jgi:hypothetical protein
MRRLMTWWKAALVLGLVLASVSACGEALVSPFADDVRAISEDREMRATMSPDARPEQVRLCAKPVWRGFGGGDVASPNYCEILPFSNCCLEQARREGRKSDVERLEPTLVADPGRVWQALARTTTFAWAMSMALPVLLLVIGLGLGAARRGEGPAGPAVLAWIGVFSLLFVTTVTFAMLQGQMDTLRKHASAPAGLLTDSVGAEADRLRSWVKEEVRSDFQGPLLKYIEAEAAAPRGQHGEVLPPSDQLLRQVLGPSRGFMARAGQAMSELQLGHLVHGSVPAPPSVLIMLVVAVVMLGLGVALGRLVPRLSRMATLVVPGASRWLGPFSGIALAIAIAAVAAIAGGKELAPAPQGQAFSAPWAWPALGIALAIHALGVILELRSSRGSKQA